MGFMKPPGFITYLLALMLAAAAVASELGLALPMLQQATFWMLLGAYGLLAVAALVRGL